MERTTGKTNTMLRELLRHSGITVEDDEETGDTQPLNNADKDQMEIEVTGPIQGVSGGTKRTRTNNLPDELIENGPLSTQNAQQA